VIGWAAGISIPIAAALLLYFYNPGILDDMGKSYASFVPTVKFTPATHKPIEVSKTTARFKNFIVTPDQETPAIAKDPVSEPAAAKPEYSLKRYQLVVGAFAENANAQHYVEKLRSMKLQASIVGKSKSGLTRVSIDGSDSKKEALAMLDRIREDINPNAWLLRIR
jgi:cell division septation protein DedD